MRGSLLKRASGAKRRTSRKKAVIQEQQRAVEIFKSTYMYEKKCIFSQSANGFGAPMVWKPLPLFSFPILTERERKLDFAHTQFVRGETAMPRESLELRGMKSK